MRKRLDDDNFVQKASTLATDAKSKSEPPNKKSAAAIAAEGQELREKFQEMEVQVLEAREAQEIAESALEQGKSDAQTLERAVAKEKAHVEETQAAASAKEAELKQLVEETTAAHVAELQVQGAKYEELANRFATLEQDLAEARAAVEKANADAVAVAEENSVKVEELEKTYLIAQTALNDKIVAVTEELGVRPSFGMLSLV